MAVPKSLFSLRSHVAVLLLLVVTLGTKMGMAQNICTTQLSNLNVCAPFVVPGALGAPSAGCCDALQAVNPDCLCNTLRIASQLPSQCQLPPLDCGTN
ncbi:PREDICTED: protein 108-like [Lupinus angustifolius]|uniref:protein 108-like n=1 Tax=Lupinus angustifolius TaxID=3871 RepID=UPI00092F1C74|nr:PREDICTED: protein 108-like [Lupinus angustifolius]